MHIMWNSVAPWVPTGYGTQTGLFTSRFRDAGHDVAISSNWGWHGGIGAWDNIPVYPADHTNLNKTMLRRHVEHWADANGWDRSDVQILTLHDVHTWINPQFGRPADFHGLRQTAWVPIDHNPAPPLVVKALQTYDVQRPIAMSLFGREKLAEQGFDPLYVPHGIDPAYTPQPDRDAYREAMLIPPDRFVIGMVANNQGIYPSRKAFPQVLHAFRVFLDKHPDAFLYLHCDIFGHYEGINLMALAETFDIPVGSIGTCNQTSYHLGIPVTEMARIYSALDVLANPSLGEGFGIPIVEAQACGTPVIVTDWTAMTELCGAGWLVDGEMTWDVAQGAWWKTPAVSEIIKAFELAYEHRDDLELRDSAALFGKQYHADTVMADHWVPALDQLDKPREVAALPNRAAKRAAKRAGRQAA